MRKYNETSFFWALDGFRGIAAICVVLYHYSMHINPLYVAGKVLMPDAFLAVDLFFVLSGFIIAHAYQSRLEKGLRLTIFVRSRLMRLYPLYFISITISLLLLILTTLTEQDHQSSVKTVLSYMLHLLFLPSPPQLLPVTWGIFPLNAVAWSLSLEMGINIVYARFYIWLSPGRLLFLISLSAMGLSWSVIHYETLNVGLFWQTYMGGWIRVCYSFFAGALLYSCYKRYDFPQLPSWVALVLGVSIIAIFSCPESAFLIPCISIIIVFPIIIWL